MKVCMKAVMLNMTVTDQFHMDLVVKVRLILTIGHMTASNPVTQAPGLGKLTQTPWSQVSESENGHLNFQFDSLVSGYSW